MFVALLVIEDRLLNLLKPSLLLFLGDVLHHLDDSLGVILNLKLIHLTFRYLFDLWSLTLLVQNLLGNVGDKRRHYSLDTK